MIRRQVVEYMTTDGKVGDIIDDGYVRRRRALWSTLSVKPNILEGIDENLEDRLFSNPQAKS